MGFVGAVVPTSGITGFLLGILSGVYYFATPENQWANYLHPNMPGWAVPSNENHAMTWFYEGLPEGQPAPYHAWIAPLISWIFFLLALCTLLFCIAVILRKQWVRNERLVFPLASVGATLTRATRGGFLPDALRGGLFWGGFGVGFGAISWNILNYFWPVVPKIPLQGKWVVFAKGFPRVNTRINFLTAGFAYFANLNILFSIWVFFVSSSGLKTALSPHRLRHPAQTPQLFRRNRGHGLAGLRCADRAGAVEPLDRPHPYQSRLRQGVREG